MLVRHSIPAPRAPRAASRIFLVSLLASLSMTASLAAAGEAAVPDLSAAAQAGGGQVAPALTRPPCSEQAPVALVRGTFTAAEDHRSEGPTAARTALLVARVLARAGIPFDELADEDLGQAGDGVAPALAGRKVAILPYNPRLAPGEREALVRFAAGGGKLVVFYTADRSLWTSLGVAGARVRPRSRRGEFAEMRFVPDALPFAPAAVYQDSWNIMDVSVAPGGRVLASWHDRTGTGPIAPAVVAGDGGALVTHIMLGGPTEAKSLMMLSLCAWLAGPPVTEPVARGRLRAARVVSTWEGLGGASSLARAVDDPRADRDSILDALDGAARAERLAVEALDVGAFEEALRQSLAAERLAREAAASAQPARPGEIRAVWVRFPEDVDWLLVAPRLARAGINVVLPNYVRGLRAAYASRVLDGTDEDNRLGSIETCIRECRRAGVEVHVWWTVLFLDDTPRERAEALAREGRLVVGPEGEAVGKAGTAWLCPTHPANVALVVAAARELVERYGPDGIHLDYIRLPLERSCLCERCREAFVRSQGAVDWPGEVLPGARLGGEYAGFRRGRIGALVEEIRRASRAGTGAVYLSAAVFPELAACRQTLAQDWGDWVDRGLVDFVAPMDYTDSPEELARWVREQSRRIAARVPLVPGVGLAAGRVELEDPADLLRQISIIRESGGDGFAVFQLSSEFLTKHLDFIRRGPGRAGAEVRPHGGPMLSWRLPDGLDGDALAAGGGIDVAVSVEPRTAGGLRVDEFGDEPRGGRLLPRIELETATGRLIGDLGPGPAPGAELNVPVAVPTGPFRIVVRGEATAGGTGPRPVAIRSPVFVGVTVEEARAARTRAAPAGVGPRVAVLAGGYGSRGVLACLRRAGGFAAYPIDSLDLLRAAPDGRGEGRPDVLVLTQRRDPGGLDAAARVALRSYVEDGGAILATHDACGYRYHPVLFAEVSAGGERHVKSAALTVVAGTWLARELGEAPIPHAHYDHVVLAPGASGEVVARGESGPAVVAGMVGRGRVVACGVALGIDASERERPPEGQERDLLVALVRHLVRNGR